MTVSFQSVNMVAEAAAQGTTGRTFSLWSLDFIYYPVSGIMWVWHKIFGAIFSVFGAEDPGSNPWTWVLSVIFLVFTLRGIMFKPFMKQMDSSLKMQKIQPEMKRLREKYKDDRQRLTEEMMKLNKEAGVNPLASCLPALLQAPAFIGLFHVLRNFITAYNGGPDAEAGAAPVINYFFSVGDVESFHDALLFGGASLSGHLTMTAAELGALQADRDTMLWVGIPLMILAAVATHLSSRKSVARQTQLGTASSGGQMAIMQKLMLYVFPLGVLVIGAFYPLALLFYWLANNFWTFGQLAIAHRIQDRKISAESNVVDALPDTSFSTPKPGARPNRRPQRGASSAPRQVTSADNSSSRPGSKSADSTRPASSPAGRAREGGSTSTGAASSGAGSRSGPAKPPSKSGKGSKKRKR